MSEHPFIRTFTEPRTRDYFEEIGWVPFTCKCLNHPKARHNLGQTNNDENLEEIDHDYKAAVKKSESKGFNPVSNPEINTSQKPEAKKTEYEQVAALDKRKTAFSASGILHNVGSMVITDHTATSPGRLLLQKIDAKKHKISVEKEREKRDLTKQPRFRRSVLEETSYF